jgi:hypothetical protein
MSVVTYYPGYSQLQVHQNLVAKTILTITNANPMVVTTDQDHGYVAGMNVNFLIPIQFGMQELNRVTLQVISLTSNTVTINFDSTVISAFSYPSPLPNAYTPPSIIPFSSGPYLPPLPLPVGNQNSFEGTIFNNGIS